MLDRRVRKSLKEATSKLRREDVSEAQQRVFQAERKAWEMAYYLLKELQISPWNQKANVRGGWK